MSNSRHRTVCRLASACFVALLVALAGCDSQSRYEMQAAHGSTPEEDRVWILDTFTRQVSLCYESAATVKWLAQSSAPTASRN
jgi:hypothetical protein